jgi:hypothetical protein
MKVIISTFLLGLCLTAKAERFQSKIHSIETSTNTGVPHLIKLENGRVLFIDYPLQSLLASFQQSLKLDDLLEIELDEQDRFLRAETLERPLVSEMPKTSRTLQRMSYQPTLVSSLAAATNIFRRMRQDYQNNSQCYNRAHVWAYEEFLHSRLKSKKLFIFFTNRYIRNYRFKWWFHVAPLALVKTERSSAELVLDRRYTHGPQSISNWRQIFVPTRRGCPMVHKYSHYRNNQEREDCFLIPVSMFFWQPRDIERRDHSGAEKRQFFRSEIDWSYREAF